MLPAKAPRARRSPLHTSALIPAVATLALFGAGCGDEDEEDDSAAISDTAIELHLALDPDGPGGKEPMPEIARCEVADGSECGRLGPLDFAPIDPQTPCTEIYGGPDEVEVTGTVAGEPIDTAFTRANGCEIERFDVLTPLLQELFPGYRPGASLRP